MLTQLVDGIWTAAAPLRMLGLHLGTRMTVVRLSSGKLLLHSPVPLDAGLREAIAALGEVAHIVCPNTYHHLYAGNARAAFPGAMLHGPPGLRAKRKDLAFDAALGETPHPDWAGDLEPVNIRGTLLDETVLYHAATRTLVSSDLVENFATSPHWLTRGYLRLAGVHGKVGWSKLLRFVYRDRAAARADIERVLDLDFERVVVAHGDIVTHDAKNAVRSAFEWL